MKKLLTIAGLVSALSVGSAFAAPTAVSGVSVGSQSGSLSAGTTGSATYVVTVNRTGSGSLTPTMGVTGLPSGVTGSFSPTISFTGGTASATTSLTLTATTGTSAGTTNFTVSADTATTSGSLIIGAALTSQTITFNTISGKTYGDADFALSTYGSASSGLTPTFTSSSTSVCTVVSGNLHIVTAGSCTVTAYQSGNGTYAAATPVAQTFSIAKATPTLSVTNSPVTYDGTAKTPTVVASGSLAGTISNVSVGGASSQTNAGTYAVTADFVPTDTTDYNSLTTASAGNFVISKINTTTTVTCPVTAQVYTGSAQTPCTASVTGTGLSLTPTPDYTNNLNAGTASASYNYAGDANYNASSDTKTFTISKANATINITPYSGTYDAAAHGLTGTATGVMAEDLSPSLNLGSTYTDAPGANVNWAFNGGTNYNNDGGTAAITINKLTVTATVTASSKSYDGDNSATIINCSLTGVINSDDVTCSAAGATFDDQNVGTAKTVTATGITLGGTKAGDYQLSATTATTSADITARAITVTADPNQTKIYGDPDPALTYTVTSGSVVAPDAFTGALTYTGTDVGSYPIATGTLALSNNYAITFVSNNFTITPANAAITLTGNFNPVYNGTPQGLSATTAATSYDITYNGSTTTPTNAGTYSVVATITDPNYSGTANGTLTIKKADPVISVTPYSVTYDGSTYTSSSTITGATGDDLTSMLNVSATAHTNAGTYNGDAWTFTDTTGNYNNMSGMVDNAIAKATPGIVVSNNSSFWDGAAKSVTVTTTPSPLSYTVTYDGLASAPSAIGTYAVVVDVNDTNYAGTATDTLTIKNNPPTIVTAGKNPLYLTVGYTGQDSIDQMANATDVEDGALTVIADKAITDDAVGQYMITYSATDSNGATATSTRQVVVVPQLTGAGGTSGVVGCMDPKATNYDAAAGFPGSCSYGQVLGAASSTDGSLVGALNLATSTLNSASSTSHGQVLGASAYGFTRDLKIGKSGVDVGELQKILIAEGFLKITTPTNYFGSITKVALIKWQTTHGIKPASGYFGALSRAFLLQ